MEARDHRHHRHQRQDDHDRAHRRAPGRAAAAGAGRRQHRHAAGRARADASRPTACRGRGVVVPARDHRRPSSRGWPPCSTSRPITSTATARSTAYLEAKARIFANQTPTDCAVLNADDPAAAGAGLAHARPRALVQPPRGARPRRVRAATAGWWPGSTATWRRSARWPRSGCAASTTSRTSWPRPPARSGSGVGAEAIRRAIGRFRAVEHRIEFVRDLRGVQFYNDSKGTNVASTHQGARELRRARGADRGRQGQGPGLRRRWPRPRAGASATRSLIGEDGPKIGAALGGVGIPVTSARHDAGGDRRGARARPGRATSSCSRRPARRSTCSTTTSIAATSSRSSSERSTDASRARRRQRRRGRRGLGRAQWLACATRAGLARPPIPQRGLGRGLSIVGGSLAPPAAIGRRYGSPSGAPRHPSPSTAVRRAPCVHSIGGISHRRRGGGRGERARFAEVR